MRPSLAMPHCTPPFVPPFPTRVSHSILPLLAGSSAYTTPDFCPATRTSRPSGSTHQHRRGAVIVVGAAVLGAIRSTRAARRVVDIVRRRLLRPDDGAGLEVERENGVARRRRGMRVVVAARDVEDAARRDRSWAWTRPPRPKARMCRSRQPSRRSSLVDPRGTVFHTQRSVPDAERCDASPERAAWICRIDRPGLFPRRRRNERDAVLHGDRPGQPRGLVLFDFLLPVFLAGAGVERVDGAILVAEHQRGAGRRRWRRSSPPARDRSPDTASGGNRSERRAPERRRRRCRRTASR